MERSELSNGSEPYPGDEALLTVEGVETGYGKKRVLDDVSITVGRSEAIALLGHNGAGKTTLLRAIFGIQALWKGAITFDGRRLGSAHSPRHAVDKGMAMIPSERFVFPDLTVFENLRVSAQGLDPEERGRRLEEAYNTYPILKQRSDQLAGAMSGGEQRMVSLSMALMKRPSLLLLDEPSLGLSPALAEQLMVRVRTLVEGGTSVVLVEQNVPAALGVASRVYVVRSGRIIAEEPARSLAERGHESWWELF